MNREELIARRVDEAMALLDAPDVLPAAPELTVRIRARAAQRSSWRRIARKDAAPVLLVVLLAADIIIAWRTLDVATPESARSDRSALHIELARDLGIDGWAARGAGE